MRGISEPQQSDLYMVICQDYSSSVKALPFAYNSREEAEAEAVKKTLTGESGAQWTTYKLVEPDR